jgi:hypothetical protein
MDDYTGFQSTIPINPPSPEYIFVLKDGIVIKYVFYDIKEALEKAILLNLSLTRLHRLDGGVVREMIIYFPSASQN